MGDDSEWTAERVIACLSSNEPELLVGLFESQWLECKRQPYQLQHDGQKLELAKDVSGLANADGGIILLGFATTRSDTHGSDVISELKPVPLNQVDPGQYRSIVGDWTWPQFRDCEIRVFPAATDLNQGYVAIVVPKCATIERPILICKAIVDERKTDLVFGYAERKQADVVHHAASRLHSLIASGLNRDEVIARLETVIALLTESVSARTGARPDDGYVTVDESGELSPRIAAAIEAAGLHGRSVFILTAFPHQPLDVRDGFSSRSAPLAKLLESPPELRHAGFDLTTDALSQIVGGTLRRTVHEGAKDLEIHRDGTIIFVNDGDRGGLCWGRDQAQANKSIINQLALIENTVLFTQVVRDAYIDRLPVGSLVTYRAELRNADASKRPYMLPRGALDQWGGAHGQTVASGSISSTCTEPFDPATPEGAAFHLLEDIYLTFGLEVDDIPYAAHVAELGRVIDVQAILKASR